MNSLKNFKSHYYEHNKFNIDDLKKHFLVKNVMEIPKIDKIVITSMSKEVVSNSTKILNEIRNILHLISLQEPCKTFAKKSISNFKTREGMHLGYKVTLRKENMYQFLKKFIILTLPGIRDFRGFSEKSFDKNGNLHFGIKDSTCFPELNQVSEYKKHGLRISFITNSSSVAKSKKLLSYFNFPFIK